MKMLKAVRDFLFPMCPSGTGHRVRVGVVQGVDGWEGCWHKDCMMSFQRLCHAAAQKERDAQMSIYMDVFAAKLRDSIREVLAQEKRPGGLLA